MTSKHDILAIVAGVCAVLAPVADLGFGFKNLGLIFFFCGMVCVALYIQAGPGHTKAERVKE